MIYKYTNKINGKVYIGKTVDLKARHYQHLNDRRYKCYFHNAIDKYGIENFDLEVIFIADSSLNQSELNDILNEKERYYIQVYDSFNRDKGYNMTLGGDGIAGRFGELNPFFNKKHSEESKLKISEANKGRIQTDEEKQKRNESLKKVIHNEEWNKKVGLANRKPITALKDGNEVGNYSCYEECRAALNLPNIRGISKVITGIRKAYYGYTFKLTKIENNLINKTEKPNENEDTTAE